MPALGADMEAGTLIEWLKRPGDSVHRGDIIAVVDTQKGAIDIEVFEDGVLERTVVEPMSKVPVGTVLAIIRPAGAPAGTAAERPPPAARVRATPAARALASERGLDLSTVAGTGADGAVTREDVERAAIARATAQAPPSPSAQEQPPGAPADRIASMRAAIGAAMARSKREIPHFYLTTAIEMQKALAWQSGQNAARPVADRLLTVVLLIKAVALALKEHPQLNGFWTDGAFRPGTGIHVGSATALRGGGLIAPAIRDADRKSLDLVMRDLRDLVTRARAGSLRSSDLSDATITVTSLGDEGVETVHGIIYPPQVALVGFGGLVERPALVEGHLQTVPVLAATLSADHRAVDGRRGAQFLAAVRQRLQHPEQL
jgi:pyruvate dehydrogenase E2 component (dihydrolipoamide acetyltransferase)